MTKNMLKRNKNSQPVIKKDLEKALEGQSKVILEAVDFGFKKVKTDISGLKTDISGLKTDISGLKTDISGLKTDMGKVQKAVTGLQKDSRQSLTKQDRICKQLSDLQQESKMSTGLYKGHDKKLEDHEGRISHLELEIQPVKHE